MLLSDRSIVCTTANQCTYSNKIGKASKSLAKQSANQIFLDRYEALGLTLPEGCSPAVKFYIYFIFCECKFDRI